jgi:sugar lactone lactonase YvrE
MNSMKTAKFSVPVIALLLIAFGMMDATHTAANSPALQATAVATLPATATAAATTASANDSVTDRVVAQMEGLFPEGVEYDAKNSRFLVSSTTKGTVYTIGADGRTIPLVEDARIPSSLGLEVDEANERLFVVAHDYDKKAFLGIYNATTGQNTAWVDLATLTPRAAKRFPNDVTVDQNGVAYVTDSWVGAIYRVAPGGQASIFLQDDSFATDFALNGIAYNAAGNYLVAVLNPGLIKIPLDNPKSFTTVVVAGALGNQDGIVFLNDTTLAIVANQQGKVIRVESNDNFVTAKVTGEFATGNVFPTTVAARDGAAYVLYSYLNKEDEIISDFPIQRAGFGATP